MSKKASNAHAQRNTESLSNDSLAMADSGAASDLQQVQNLLFGAQAREIEQNMRSLEDRIDQRFDLLAQSMESKLDELTRALTAQVGEERNERLLSCEVLSKGVEELRAGVKVAVSELSEQQQSARDEIAQDLESAKSSLSTQLLVQGEELTSQFSSKHSELDEAKLSKKALSKLLSDLAVAV